MKQVKLVLVILVGSAFAACNQKNNKENTSDLKILQQFESEIKESIDRRNAKGQSVSSDIILDTLYTEKLVNSNYTLAFAQYHSKDNKLDLSILGIENFDGPVTPTYLLVDDRQKEYIIDSVKMIRDSLHVYCRAVLESEQEDMKISFDLKFNGNAFPWSVDTGEQSIEDTAEKIDKPAQRQI